MLETAVQLESSPPVTVASASTKSVDASERVKVSVDDSPALKELSASSSVMAMVGRVVSSIKLRPKLVIRASVIELAPTEPTTNALFSNSSSMLLKSSDVVWLVAFPVTVIVAVVSDARVTTVVSPAGTFVAL